MKINKRIRVQDVLFICADIFDQWANHFSTWRFFSIIFDEHVRFSLPSECRFVKKNLALAPYAWYFRLRENWSIITIIFAIQKLMHFLISWVRERGRGGVLTHDMQYSVLFFFFFHSVSMDHNCCTLSLYIRPVVSCVYRLERKRVFRYCTRDRININTNVLQNLRQSSRTKIIKPDIVQPP